LEFRFGNIHRFFSDFGRACRRFNYGGANFTRLSATYRSTVSPLANRFFGLIVPQGFEILVLFKEVGDVEKRIALQTQIDERRLHSRKHACYAALVNAAR